MPKVFFTVLAFLAIGSISTAEARHYRHPAALDQGCNVIFPCVPMAGQAAPSNNPFSGARSIMVTMRRVRRPAAINRRHHADAPVALPPASWVSYPSAGHRTAAPANQVISGRPAGCPWAFCGCEASLHLFGRIVPDLNLAANWLRFPKAAPAPRMAAVRSHHVMVLESLVEGNVWLVHDGNSGGHLTRLHPRSIAGYAIVDPSGGA